MFHWTYNLPRGHFCILFQQLLCECSYLTTSEDLAQIPLQETELMMIPSCKKVLANETDFVH